MKLYMAVTPDSFELPLFVSPYAMEMAEKYSTTVKRIEWEVHSSRAKTQLRGTMRGYKFLKINVEDGDYEN